MPRRKKGGSEEKSTVIKIRDGFDWGRILYDACHVFNRRMAEYLVEYAKRYDDGEVAVKNANEEIGALVETGSLEKGRFCMMRSGAPLQAK